ncbi:tRNA (adenosine(37)-N6)-threonylcarbamoyltransferase complex ATPase subunit type 1 TsaE [Erythrobacteraceae bacterium CFH 75059]|uniref:tRNA (adenosine(37)-N6)-threonylcarbamoyltransferase complex ATPase subunit type 1 TsaE n=1 Tax=Qipengyuania thermophila TaxID=2509361 RepID=UPI0010206CE4|nr:tRNA (adenosine(37)-N6)-threonylcarbamoyltransferase complex ATPase subunit type 1 TsaE [Qipengyuania thermophila]TCD05053.1 tRNA (adenosine(37)-N6)-threonylcarbamoyltransferase complex ATPase subunit type 1 TsaE [Erythrobacteraceae bacterium CFH 75059]
MTANDAVSEWALADLEAVEHLGGRIAAVLEPGDVVALEGPLGAGKTSLARAILRGCGFAGEVPSPTFTIIELYEPPLTRLPVVHADFYRVSSLRERDELGLTDYRRGAVLLAEWPEKIGGFSEDPQCLRIGIAFAATGRWATIERGDAWRNRML